ncbi:MAG: acyltransferase [Candidatus Adiutrix sp.]|nr:acyltransferase [Candidatus Adiutrix sp.]
MRTNHITLLKTLCLMGVLFMHAAFPFTAPGRFWRLYAEQQSLVAESLIFWAGLVIIPSFMFASGYLAALSGLRHSRSVTGQIGNRAKRLLVPWFCLMVFWMVPLYTFFDLPAYNRPEGFTLSQTYMAALSGQFADHLWFLLVLFWVSSFWAVIQPTAKRFGPLAAPALALAASLLIYRYGQGLTWCCFYETDGPLLWFAAGCLFFNCRQRAERAMALRPRLWFAANIALFAALSLYGPQTPVFRWATSTLGALAAFQICAHLARRHEKLRQLRPYRYFEDNAFRFYLFHMPGGLLTFKMLDWGGLASPLPFIGLSFLANFCLTAGIVEVVNKLEKGLFRASGPPRAGQTALT